MIATKFDFFSLFLLPLGTRRRRHASSMVLELLFMLYFSSNLCALEEGMQIHSYTLQHASADLDRAHR